MLLVLILGAASVSASEDNETGLEATDEHDEVSQTRNEIEELSATNDLLDSSNTISVEKDNIQNNSNEKILMSTSDESDEIISVNNDEEILNDGSASEFETVINSISANTITKFTKNYQINTYTATISHSNIIIDGCGHTINANNNQLLLTFTGTNVTIKNIIFTNIKCNVGPIKLGGSYQNVSNCTFSKITQNTGSGGIYETGIIYTSGTNLLIEKSTFTQNSLSCTSGGTIGIYTGPTGSKVKIDSCSFTKNTAISGAQYHLVFLRGASDSVTGCEFIDNNYLDAVTIGGSATGASLSNSTFINNKNAYQAAVYANGDLSFQYCTFINNTGLQGGAFYNAGGFVKFNYNIFIDVKSPKNNGIYVSQKPDLNYNWWGTNDGPSSSSFANSAWLPEIWYVYNVNPLMYSSMGDGRYVAVLEQKFMEYNKVSRKYSDISNPLMVINRPVTIVDLSNGEFFGSNSVGNLYWQGTESGFSVTLQVDSIRTSVEVGDPTTEPERQYNFLVLQSLIEAYNEKNNNNVFNLDHDYTYDDRFDSSLNEGIIFSKGTLNGCGFTLNGNNKARILNVGGNVIIKNTNLVNGNATVGGAIYSNGNTLKINNCNFTNNVATSGGAIYCYGGSLEINNSIFSNNVATNGGAICTNNVATLLDSITFINNRANLGSIINSNGNTLNLNKITFNSNTEIYLDNVVVNILGDVVVNGVSGKSYFAKDIYVSTNGGGSGLTAANPISLNDAFKHSLNNGNIILANGNYNIAKIAIDNLNKVTIVGNNSSIRRTGSENYLFILEGGSNIIFNNLTLDGGIQVTSGSNLDLNNIIFITSSGKGIVYESGSSGSITNSEFTASTGLSHLVTVNGAVNIDNTEFHDNTLTSSAVYYGSSSSGKVTNSLLENEFTLTKTGNIYYGTDEVIGGTFVSNAPSTITLYLNDVSKGSASVSSNKFSKTLSLLPVGTYTISFKDGNSNTYTFTDNTFTVSRLSTVYISPSGTGSGNSASSSTTWDKVSSIITSDGTVVFADGTYSNFYGKTISQSWTLNAASGATPVLDANNNGRIFTISANNIKINGLTFKNGKATDSNGGAIHWTGTGGSITNSVLTENTGRPITATSSVSITNTQMKNQATLTKTGNINWGASETITATFAHSAPSTVNILLNGASQGPYSVSSSKVTATYAYTNPTARSIGSYVVTDQKNNHKEVF